MTVTLRPAAEADLMPVGALHQRSRVAAYSSFLPPEALADPTPEAMGRYWTIPPPACSTPSTSTPTSGAGAPGGS